MSDFGLGKHIVLVGGGLAGALLAPSLADLGYRVSVYERRGDPRAKGYVGGRSINLALSVRGIEALKRLGLAQAVLNDAIRMPGRMLHSPTGQLAYQAYSKNPADAINSVSRGGLNVTLIEAAAKHPNVSFFFDQRCVDVEPDSPNGPAATFEDATRPPGQSPTTRVRGDVVIGTDGAFSAVRMRLQKNDRFEFSQSYLSHGYKELHIPPKVGANGQPEFAMEANALHIWPRKSAMMIALPNADKSFTCTLFWPWEGEHSFANLKSDAEIREFFQEHYPDAVPLMPTLVEDFTRNPTSSLVTIRCWPWQHAGRVAILGDAAHAIVPFFGQGMNCAFEDCAALTDLVIKHRGDWSRVLPEFQALRKPNSDAIADMALDNFIEMRDKVGSRAFRLKKKLEHALHALLPGAFLPLYNMVSFSTIPYAAAKARARKQSAIIRGVALSLGITLAITLIALARLSQR